MTSLMGAGTRGGVIAGVSMAPGAAACGALVGLTALVMSADNEYRRQVRLAYGPPGWYADPRNPEWQRYWAGAESGAKCWGWTESTRLVKDVESALKCKRQRKRRVRVFNTPIQVA